MHRLFFCAVFYLALVSNVTAQKAGVAPKPATGIVTLLSDALSEPNSLASQILSDISVTLDKESNLRVLSVAGYGGAANVRDLLQLRGADLAVLNNDVLAYLDLTRALPDARKKVRVVVPLSQQGVFLFAREPIKSILDLKGRKLGVPGGKPSRLVTAKTIFSRLKIEAEIIEIDDKSPEKHAAPDVDAVLLYEGDLRNLNAFGITADTYRLVSIPASGPLSQIYPSKIYPSNLLGSFASAKDLETVQVTTLLASFDWSAKASRYNDVVKFVQKLFAALPVLRNHNRDATFNPTDIKAGLPGWVRYGPAIAAAASLPPLAAKADSTATPLFLLSPQPNGESDVVRLAVVARPPLSDPHRDDGGVVLKLFVDALNSEGLQTAIQWTDSERSQLEEVINAKTSDAGLFWQTPNCETPRNLSANEAALCDGAALSDPIMQVVIGVFTRLDKTLSGPPEDAGKGRVLCVPESQSIPGAALAAIPWIRAETIKIVRPKTLIDCLAAVERREADGLIAIEAEGRFVIEKLKLADVLQLSQRLETTIGLHAIIAKENPHQAQLLARINQALAKLRSSHRYSEIMTAHLADLVSSSAQAAAKP